MTPEHRLMNEIKLWCGEHNWLCIRLNVGTHKLADGSYFDTGIPKGFPDLMVLTDNNRTIFVETKVKPNKPSIDQLNVVETLKNRGFLAFVCYSLDEFVSMV